MATIVLSVIGGDDQFVTGFSPAGNVSGEFFVQLEASVVHLLAFMEEAMAHAVERTRVVEPVVQIKAFAQHGECGEKVGISGGHLVGKAVARHGVEAAVVDRHAFWFVAFDIADRFERGAVEEFRPEGMGDCAGSGASFAGF